MFSVTKVEKQIGGRALSIETGKIANQADGSVIVRYGDTMVLVTVCVAPPRSEDIDFFPLSVDYREKTSAVGKFPGGFFKREGRPTTKEILTSRKIDRPVRPLFPEGYFQEVQIMASVLGADEENDPDILAMIGASAALSISKIPFLGPIAACRVAREEGNLIINPTYAQLKESDLNLLLCGKRDSMNMIEVESKEVEEQVVADAIKEAQSVIADVCDLIDELTSKVGVEKEITLFEMNEAVYEEIKNEIGDKLYQAKQTVGKAERKQAVSQLYKEIEEKYCNSEDPKCEKSMLKRILGKIEGDTVQQLIWDGKRPDGRGYDEVRPLGCEVGLLPRNHGSALFSRGETQALISVTLGTVRDAQLVEGLTEEVNQTFSLHYNFPPYSVGEVRFIRGPGRREIGHGALAEKALEQVRPDQDDFAYTIRVVSDITGSNGSSSMASVCGGSLALMDAGVPMKNPVAGISIGMVLRENGEYKLLTDILGEEDHFGHMDFKVAGTPKGITAIQLDIKAEGLSFDIMVEALQKAKTARAHILEAMGKAISEPKPELSAYAPKLISINIPPDKIGMIIGPGGKMIKSIQEQTGANLEIEEDGTVFISCVKGDGHLAAKEIVEAMTTPPVVGKIYKKSKVVSVKDFGVFVEIIPGVEGLCHVSELSNQYVKNIEDVCKTGDIIPVKLILIDDQGRLKLSRKAAMAELGEEDKPKESSK